ncbi:DNA recombination protein RmuC [Amaricoccus sp.]|uniref:DNA recombination protein RmuC n=1 Tax=Amaricoccus sp. TaxID=1872485 RepID=UPI001B5B6C4E|nr:DNA recombination protein RmuC [Amaricoccus sp.]MBP7002901.1 DNA recombination protein RmuC [Amaricoccus sp.]
MLDLGDPRLWGVLAGLALLWLILAAARRLAALDGAVRGLDEGQHRLHGGLVHVAEAQASAQARALQAMEAGLGQSAIRTARSLGELQQRLEAIDRAQAKIEKLSGDVLGLQDILSNKQTRGAFGEIQLRDIVTKALPPDAAEFQAQLSNGRRVDCLIRLPQPPGPIAIDAKFPLEAYEALRAARTPAETAEAARRMRAAVRTHLRAIAEKYVIEGETAEGALMFLPSEAVYAELHANFGDLVREGFTLRVWIVSPTTCMATLTTLRAVLKDARLKAEAHAIRRELGLLGRDLERLGERVGALDRHFGQAAADLAEVKVSAGRAGARARRLEDLDFAEDERPTPPPRPRIIREDGPEGKMSHSGTSS